VPKLFRFVSLFPSFYPSLILQVGFVRALWCFRHCTKYVYEYRQDGGNSSYI